MNRLKPHKLSLWFNWTYFLLTLPHNLKSYTPFYTSYSSNNHVLFLLRDKFLFHLYFSLNLRPAFSSAIFVFEILRYYLVTLLLAIWKKWIGVI